MTEDTLPDLPALPGFSEPPPVAAESPRQNEDAPKKSRRVGRPRKRPVAATPPSGGPEAATPLRGAPALPEAEAPSPEPEHGGPETASPLRGAEEAAAQAEATATPESSREAAKLLRRSLDDMTSSVLEMENLFRSAPPVGASAAVLRAMPASGGGKRGKHGKPPFPPPRGGGPRQSQPPQPPRKAPPAAVHADANAQPGGAIASRFGPQAAAAARGGSVDAGAATLPGGQAPAPETAPELPVVKLADLRALSCAELLSLAREQRVFDQSLPRRKSDLVFQLAVKHALRGGVVECDGRLEIPTQAEAAEASIAASAAGASRAEARAAAHNCYLRSAAAGFSPDPSDAVLPHEIRDRYGLRQGDKVVCRAKFVTGGTFGGQFEATELVSVNDGDPARARLAPIFDAMPIEEPSRRIRLRSAAAPNPALDAFDTLAPLAFGQRALLVAPDTSALHGVLSAAAAAICANHPSARVVLAEPCALPEDFPDGASDAPGGPAFTFCSTRFDDAQDKPARLVGMICESARRLVECGNDVVLLLGSVPEFLNFQAAEMGLVAKRNAPAAPSEEAFAAVRRLFASARAVAGGGSLTVVAAVAGATGRFATPRREALLRALAPAAAAVLALGEDGSADAPGTWARAPEKLSTPEESASRSRIRAGDPLPDALSALPPPPALEATPALPVFLTPQ